MNYQIIEKILIAFSDELVQKLKDDIDTIIWYGSTANNKADEDSDIDVALITKNENNEIWKAANEIAAKYSLQYDCLISPLIVSNNRFENMKSIGRLIAVNITNNGKVLWQKAA
ncbi:nucleotidyltransferase domain-containing protein [candidate division KSB1 bacterium]|nr:nucleotidyltransferase domain-containing protein [candidate division KSB1 bacterium]MBL7095249.1 nucleotidyltransferase domain-containing protein [candidate division KSB1 bacterium]